jgi:hypothetical protein
MNKIKIKPKDNQTILGIVWSDFLGLIKYLKAKNK